MPSEAGRVAPLSPAWPTAAMDEGVMSWADEKGCEHEKVTVLLVVLLIRT